MRTNEIRGRRPFRGRRPTRNLSPRGKDPTNDMYVKSLELSLMVQHCGAGGSDQSVINDAERTGNVTQRVATEEESSVTELSAVQRSIFGLGFEISLCGNLLIPGMGSSSAEEAFDDHSISEEEFRKCGPSIIKDANLIIRLEERYFLWDKVAHIIFGKAVFGSHFSVEPKDSMRVEHKETTNTGDDTGPISPTYSRRWILWSMPFRRAKSFQHNDSNSSNEKIFVYSESGLQNANTEQISNANNNQSPHKQYLQTNILTTEQIASLNLKEGQNKMAFSFSIRVLGKQEVDAHVYLLKWNARIVISDVDGTITKEAEVVAMITVGGEIKLEYTPTWIVAGICMVMVLISLIVEHVLHFIGKVLKKNQKPLYESLLKVKEELILMGFISLMLLAFQGLIQRICIPVRITRNMIPWNDEDKVIYNSTGTGGAKPRLLTVGSGNSTYCQNKLRHR